MRNTRLSPIFACSGSQVHGARGRPLKAIQPQGGGLRFWHPRLADARARAAVCRLRRDDLLPARLPSGRAAKDPARHAAAARRVRGTCTHTAAFPSFFPLFATCTHMPLLSHRQTGSYCNAGRWNRRAAPSSRPSCRFSMSCYVNTATIGRRPHQGARAAHGAPPAVEDEDTYSHCLSRHKI